MSWVATEDFDSYSATADLNAQNGGTGWSSGWDLFDGGAWTVETAPAGGQGGNTARCAANVTNTKYRRALTSTTTEGTLQWQMRINRTDPNAFTAVVLTSDHGSGSIPYISCSFSADGQIQIYNGNGDVFVNLQAYSADTWYTITLDFNSTQYRAKVDSGSYSSFVDIDNGPMTSIGSIMLWCSATNTTTFYVDDIRPGGSYKPRAMLLGVG